MINLAIGWLEKSEVRRDGKETALFGAMAQSVSEFPTGTLKQTSFIV